MVSTSRNSPHRHQALEQASSPHRAPSLPLAQLASSSPPELRSQPPHPRPGGPRRHHPPRAPVYRPTSLPFLSPDTAPPHLRAAAGDAWRGRRGATWATWPRSLLRAQHEAGENVMSTTLCAATLV